MTISYHKFFQSEPLTKVEKKGDDENDIGFGHYDIFLEREDEKSELLTYELKKEDWGKIQKGEWVYCTRKKDHRKIYLDFEGSISDNRGSLKIVWKGFYNEKKFIENEKIRINLENLTVLIN